MPPEKCKQGEMLRRVPVSLPMAFACEDRGKFRLPPQFAGKRCFIRESISGRVLAAPSQQPPFCAGRCKATATANETSTVRQLKTAACDVKFVTVPICADVPPCSQCNISFVSVEGAQLGLVPT